MILEIDAGNSRIKWRIVDEKQLDVVAGVNSYLEEEGLAKFISDLDRLMPEVTRIKISSVRSDKFNKELSDLFFDNWQLNPAFANVGKYCGGVTSSYTEVSTMGVDRWLAMLAAYKRSASSCCILDCGSAITFDWIDAEGLHQGGYIVPGFHLLQESLAQKTPILDINIEAWSSLVAGCNSQEAISNGILTMVTGFAEFCYKQVGTEGNQVSWFLTGGDAELISEHLSWSHQMEKDLVLDGLAIALP